MRPSVTVKVEPSERPTPARYIVGIDLGTTNCAAAFVDTTGTKPRVEDMAIPQIVAPGETEALEVLPSFHYEQASGEFPHGSLRLPWDQHESPAVVGRFARDHGAEVPGRLIMSAKSWLSHAGVDRGADLLPWHGAPDVARLSPVEATSRFLAHLKAAWDSAHPDFPLERQDVIVTVPASFDEIARELTVEAARRAGLAQVVLLEEPQAAFYSWLQSNRESRNSIVRQGQVILVCDIGGGTTDCTLIDVRPGQGDELQFHRIAVGDHLILGGDNLDLLFAYHIEHRLGGGKLGPRQFSALVRNCQKVKELLLGSDPPPAASVAILGSGTAVVGGARRIDVDQEEVRSLLIDGFFPFVAITERPAGRVSGFQEFGLPYAADPAVTRHLAAFLCAHGRQGPVRPDVILFNGGVFSSEAIRRRILDVIGSWFSTAESPFSPRVLANDRPELAVARGAAYYGLVRRGTGVRIIAGLPRSYYIGVQRPDGAMGALCIAPSGIQEGSEVEVLGKELDLLIRQPVEFPLFSSSVRTTDAPGDLIDIDPTQIQTLAPVHTVVQSGKKSVAGSAKVTINSRLTEIGTLEVWCSEIAGNRRWRLQFDVRAAPSNRLERSAPVTGVTVDEETAQLCRDEIRKVFSGAADGGDPRELMKMLERVVGINRDQWSVSLLRLLWEALIDSAPRRRDAPQLEARWFNAVGYCLRPGYGHPVDDWRIDRTWRLFHEGVAFPRNQSCRSEWLIMWRRIAGGLSTGRQQSVCAVPVTVIRSQFSQHSRKRRSAEPSWGHHEIAEAWRLVASCELLPVDLKIELGDLTISALRRSGPLSEAAAWALGRLGARVPVYGPLNQLVPTDVVERWIETVLEHSADLSSLPLCLMQIARATDDRFRDIDSGLRDRVVQFLLSRKAPEHVIDLVRRSGTLSREEESAVVGDRLPPGLQLTQ